MFVCRVIADLARNYGLPLDFLEVPITPRRNINATTPDPNVTMTISTNVRSLCRNLAAV